MQLEQRRRVERIRRQAMRRGLRVLKERNGHAAGRYLIIHTEISGALASHNRTWPHSFDLDEAEAFLQAPPIIGNEDQ